MTNSTDSQIAKPKKAKGPIRFEAVIPVAVIVTLTGLYFKFYFDNHLRKGIEWAGTQANGAEVNVASIHTSVLGGSFEMLGLQVTDKAKPQRNIFEIGKISFKFNWDALLRMKFVVDDASILNIQALNQRKKPGYVVPPTPPSKTPSALEKMEKQVLEQTQADYNDNLLGDIATVLGGTDAKDQLKNIEGELKASGRIKELEKGLKEKEKVWNERIKSLPQGKEIDELGKRLKALKFDAKNPVEFSKSLKEADKIIKEADQKVRLVTDTGKNLNEDINTYNAAFKELEKMVDEDLKDLQARLKIPSIDGADFSKKLFTQMIQQKLAGYRKYMELAREYMPPKKSAEEKAAAKLIPPKRGEGRNYRFPVTKGYPLFWLKHAAISSELGQSEFSGNIAGKLVDLTTDPSYLGKPTVLTVKGDFPKQEVMGLDAKLVFDHTTDVAKETMDMKIASFPVEGRKLADSKDVQFGFTDAKGVMQMNATLQNAQVEFKVANEFNQVKYDVGSANKQVDQILKNVVAGIPVVTLNANAIGSWDKFSLHINSNLGDELSAGFKREIQAKIDEAKAQLKKMIDEKIGGEKAKLTAEFEKIKGQVTGQLDAKKAELEKAKKTAENQVKDEQKKATSGGGKKLEEEGKKALKKLFGK